MFNYTKETIINNLSNVIIGTGSNGLASGEFAIKRGGNYKFDSIVDGKVYKAAGVSGSVGSVAITAGTLAANTVYRVTMFVSTPNTELAEYAYPNWAEFGKPVLVEFTASGTAATDANKLANVLKLALQPDNAMYSVSVTDAVVTVTMKESWMHIDEVNAEKYNSTTGAYEVITSGITSVITANVEDFATAKWLIENLRFPSQPNLRYTPLYADESPVAGTTYDQYSFLYKVKHSVPGGLSGVGQFVESVTTHVFYVPSANSATFAGYFTTAGLTVDSASASSTPKASDPAYKDASEISLDSRINALENKS